jgi:hypothetical protein
LDTLRDSLLQLEVDPHRPATIYRVARGEFVGTPTSPDPLAPDCYPETRRLLYLTADLNTASPSTASSRSRTGSSSSRRPPSRGLPGPRRRASGEALRLWPPALAGAGDRPAARGWPSTARARGNPAASSSRDSGLRAKRRGGVSGRIRGAAPVHRPPAGVTPDLGRASRRSPRPARRGGRRSSGSRRPACWRRPGRRWPPAPAPPREPGHR